MLFSDYRFTLDLHKTQSQISIPVTLGDTARKLYISFSVRGVPYVIKDGCRAVFSAKKADGTTLFNDCIIEDNMTVRYDFTANTATAEGITDCRILLYGANGRLLATPRFIMVVDKKVVYDDEIAVSDSERTSIDNMMLAETARVNAEAERVASEMARTTAENDRVSAESVRAEAESQRLSKEKDRQTSEKERIAAETARVSAEKTRVDNETTRVSAENQRNSNEQTRTASETGRIDAEKKRVSAEDLRIESETTRVQSEALRKSAEILRNQNESKRESNETERISAEAERVNNEKTRVDNENIRIENEGTRQALHEEMKKFFDGVENVLTNKNVAQELGDDPNKVLSQKVAKQAITDFADRVTAGNIIPFDIIAGTQITASGVEISVDNNGRIRLNGITGDSAANINILIDKQYATLNANTEYKVKISVISGDGPDDTGFICGSQENPTAIYAFVKTSPGTVFTFDSEVNLSRFAIMLSANTTYNNLVIAPYLASSDEYRATYDGIFYKTKDVNGSFALIANQSEYGLYFNTSAKTCTIVAGYLFDNRVYQTDIKEETITLPYMNGIIVYDKALSKFVVLPRNLTSSYNPFTQIIIATYSYYGAYVNSAHRYKVDNDIYGIKTPNAFALLSHEVDVPLKFDTTTGGNGSVMIPSATKIISGGGVIHTTENATISLLYANGYIAWENGEFRCVPQTQVVYDNNKQWSLIASYACYGGLEVSSPSYFTVNGHPLGIDITPNHDVVYPDYEFIQIPNTSGTFDNFPWSDVITIGNEIWGFYQSTDENHTNMNGTIAIYDFDTMTLKKTLKHNFGHCNTCHYNSKTDKLLIGNLPGNDTYPAALYIFDNVSSWGDHNDGTEISFDDAVGSIVDVSELANVYSSKTLGNIAACWGEPNYGKHNIIYISANFNNEFYKIVLGKGTNQLSHGVYSEATDDKFNGTYNAIGYNTFALVHNGLTEVIQGIDFADGCIFTANGHDGMFNAQWHWGTHGKMNRKEYWNQFYDDSGNKMPAVTEGMFVKDGYVYSAYWQGENGGEQIRGFIKYKI